MLLIPSCLVDDRPYLFKSNEVIEYVIWHYSSEQQEVVAYVECKKFTSSDALRKLFSPVYVYSCVGTQSFVINIFKSVSVKENPFWEVGVKHAYIDDREDLLITVRDMICYENATDRELIEDDETIICWFKYFEAFERYRQILEADCCHVKKKVKC